MALVYHKILYHNRFFKLTLGKCQHQH